MFDENEAAEERSVIWVRRAHGDFLEFPLAVREETMQAVWDMQVGEYPAIAKPFKGVGGGVHEIVVDERSDTFRTVVAVRFARAVYILHAFQKKSKTGIKTPQQHVKLIKQRLQAAEDDYKMRYG